jgi:hypothetical protein
MGDGFGVCLAFGVLGECPVDAGYPGVLALAFASEEIRSGWICSADSPAAQRPSMVWRMSSVMTGGTCLPSRAAVSSP